MRCKKIKELILSDYIDGELSERLKKKVEAHMAACPECRHLYEEVLGMSAEPLRRSGLVRPPEELWDKIKEALAPEEKEDLLTVLMENLHVFLTVRKPALAALTTVMVLILAAGIYIGSYSGRQAALNGYLNEQVSFLDSLGNGNGEDYFSIDLGLPGEDFFG